MDVLLDVEKMQLVVNLLPSQVQQVNLAHQWQNTIIPATLVVKLGLLTRDVTIQVPHDTIHITILRSRYDTYHDTAHTTYVAKNEALL